MQIVIEIDEEVYNDAMNHISNGLCKYSNEAIRNGTPLPKGHGDLIDRDELSPKIHGAKSIVAVLDAPAIVKADRENDNG